MDTTLFSMFSYLTIFDSLLTKPADPEHPVVNYEKIQRLLSTAVVYPLRK
jgi:hypothetical protein